MIEQAFYQLMAGTAAITAVVGSRIHHLERPENETGAAIVYQRVSTVPVTSLDGDSGLDAVRLQVSCYADSHLSSALLAQLVRDTIKQSATLKGTTAMVLNDTELKTGIKKTIVDFNLWQ